MKIFGSLKEGLPPEEKKSVCVCFEERLLLSLFLEEERSIYVILNQFTSPDKL